MLRRERLPVHLVGEQHLVAAAVGDRQASLVLLLDVALSHVGDDPDYSLLAARILLFDLYKRVLGKTSFADLESAHRFGFPDYIAAGGESWVRQAVG